jgi:hypothetical protein
MIFLEKEDGSKEVLWEGTKPLGTVQLEKQQAVIAGILQPTDDLCSSASVEEVLAAQAI